MAQPPKKIQQPFEKLLVPQSDKEMEKLGQGPKPEPSIYEQILGLEPGTSYIPREAARRRQKPEQIISEKETRRRSQFTFEPPTQDDAYRSEGLTPPGQKSLTRRLTESVIGPTPGMAEDPNQRFQTAGTRAKQLPTNIFDSEVFRPLTGDQTKLAKNPWKHLDQDELVQLEDPNFRAELHRVASKPALTRTPEENKLVSRFVLPALDPGVYALDLTRLENSRNRQKALSRVSRGAAFSRGLYGEAYDGPQITNPTDYLSPQYLSWKMGETVRTGLAMGVGGADAASLLSIPASQELIGDSGFVAEAYNRIFGSLSSFLDDSVTGLMSLNPEARRDPLVFDALRQDQELTQERFMSDPDRQGFGWDLLSGAASTIPFIAGTAILAPAGFGGMAPFLLGAAQSAGSAYNDARDSGATHQEALRAGHVGLAIGLLEGAGLEGNLQKFGLRQTITGALRQTAEEAGQEGVTQWLNNLNAKLVSGYDPDRALMEGVAEATAIGGILGGVFEAPGVASSLMKFRARDFRDRLVAISQATERQIQEALAAGEVEVLPNTTQFRTSMIAEATRGNREVPTISLNNLTNRLDSSINALTTGTGTTDYLNLYTKAIDGIMSFIHHEPRLETLANSVREGKGIPPGHEDVIEVLKKIHSFYTSYPLDKGITPLLDQAATQEQQDAIRRAFGSNFGFFSLRFQPGLENAGILLFDNSAASKAWSMAMYLAPAFQAIMDPSGSRAIFPLSSSVSGIPAAAAAGFAAPFQSEIEAIATLESLGLIPERTRKTFLTATTEAAKLNSDRLVFANNYREIGRVAEIALHEQVHGGQVSFSNKNLFERLVPYFFELDPESKNPLASQRIKYDSIYPVVGRAINPVVQRALAKVIPALGEEPVLRTSGTPPPQDDQYGVFYEDFAKYLQGEEFKELLSYLFHGLESYWQSEGLNKLFVGITDVTRETAEKVGKGEVTINLAAAMDPKNQGLPKNFFSEIITEILSHYFSHTFWDLKPAAKTQTYLSALYGNNQDPIRQARLNELFETFIPYYLYHLAVEETTKGPDSRQDFATFIHANRTNPLFQSAMNPRVEPDGTVVPGILQRLNILIQLKGLPTPPVLNSRPNTLEEVIRPKPVSLLNWLRILAPNLKTKDDLLTGSITELTAGRFPSALLREGEEAITRTSDPKAVTPIILKRFADAGLTLQDGSPITEKELPFLQDITGEIEEIANHLEQYENLINVPDPAKLAKDLEPVLTQLAQVIRKSEILSEYHNRYTTPGTAFYYKFALPEVARLLKEFAESLINRPEVEVSQATTQFFTPGSQARLSWYNLNAWQPFNPNLDIFERYRDYSAILFRVYRPATNVWENGLDEIPLSITKDPETIGIRLLSKVAGTLKFEKTSEETKEAIAIPYSIELVNNRPQLKVLYVQDPNATILRPEIVEAALYRVAQQYSAESISYLDKAGDPKNPYYVTLRTDPVEALDPTRGTWTTLGNTPVHRSPQRSAFRQTFDSRAEFSEAIKRALTDLEQAIEYSETEIKRPPGDRRNVANLIQQLGISFGRALGRQSKDPNRPEVEREVQDLVQGTTFIVAEFYELLGKNRKGKAVYDSEQAKGLIPLLTGRLQGLRALTNLNSYEARWLEDNLIPMLEGVLHFAYTSLGQSGMQGNQATNQEPLLDTTPAAPADSMFATILAAYRQIAEQEGATAAKMQEFAEYLAERQDLDDILVAMGISVESTGDPLSDLEDAIGKVVTKFFEGWTPGEKATVIAVAVDQEATSLVPSGRSTNSKKKARKKADAARTQGLEELTQTLDPSSLEEVSEGLEVPQFESPRGTLYNIDDLLKIEREAKEAGNRADIVSQVMWGGSREGETAPIRGLSPSEAIYLRYARAGFREVYPGVFQEPDGTYRLVSAEAGARKYVLEKTLEARRPAYVATEELLREHPGSIRLLVDFFEGQNLDPEFISRSLAILYTQDPKVFAKTLAPILGVQPWAVEALKDFGVVTQNYGTGRKQTLSFLHKTGSEKGKVNLRKFFDWVASQVIGQITWIEEDLAKSKDKQNKAWKDIFKIESEDLPKKLKYQRYPDYRIVTPADEARVPYLILPQSALNMLGWIDGYVAKLEEVQRPLTVEEVSSIPTEYNTRGLSIPLSFLWDAQGREREVMKTYELSSSDVISPFRTFLQILPEALKANIGDYRYLSGILTLLADESIKRGFEALTLVSNDPEASTSIEARVRHESFHTIQDLLSRGADQSILNDVMKDAMRQAGLIAGTVSSLHTSALRTNPLVQKAMRSMLGTAIMERANELGQVREDIFISEMVPYILEGRYMGLTPEEEVEVVTAYFEDIIANQPEELRERAKEVLRLAMEYPKMFADALVDIFEARERIENAEITNAQALAPTPPIEESGPPAEQPDQLLDVQAGGGGGTTQGGGPAPGTVAKPDAAGGGSGASQPTEPATPPRPPVTPPPPPIPQGASGPQIPLITHIVSLEALKAIVHEMVSATSQGNWTWDPDLPIFQNIGAALRANVLNLTTLANRVGIDEATLVADLADLVEESETLAGQQLQVLSELQKAYEFLFNQLVFPPTPSAPGVTPTGTSQTGGTVVPGTPPSQTGLAQAQAVLPPKIIAKQLMRVLNNSTLNYTLPQRLTALMKKNMLSVFQTASVQFVTTGLRSGIEIARGSIRGAILGGISRPGDFGLQSPSWFRRIFDSVMMSVQPSILLALNFAPNIGKFKARDALFQSLSSKMSLVDPLILLDALRAAHPRIIAKLEGEIKDWGGSDYDIMIGILETTAKDIAKVAKTPSDQALANKAIAKVDNFRKRRKFNESILGKLIRADETILDKIFLRPLTWQEYTFRQPMFVGALTEILSRKGYNLRTIYLNNDLERIEVKDLEEAMREATFFTMAQDPETEQDLLGRVAAKSISAINALGPLGLVINAFPRVIYNAIKFTWEYSPLGMLGLMSSPQFLIRFRPPRRIDPATGQFVQAKQTPDDIRFLADRLAKGLTGTMLYAVGVALADDDLIGEEWWQIKAGKDARGNQTFVDARNLFPFTPFLFFAVWLRRFQEGNVGDQSLAKDLKEMFFGFQRQASEVGDQFFFDLFDAFAAMVSGGENPAKETGDVFTRLASVPLNPLINFRYLISLFNEEERIKMDPALAGSLAPFIDKVPGKYLWGEKLGVHPLHGRTIGDFVRMYESPLGWAMGLRTGQDSFIGQEAAKFGIDVFRILPKDPIPYINHFKTQQFGTRVQALSEELAKDQTYLTESKDNRKIIIDTLLRQIASDVNEVASDRFGAETGLRSKRQELGTTKSKATGFESVYLEELKKLRQQINLNEFECGVRKRPPFPVYQAPAKPSPTPTPEVAPLAPEMNLEELLNENEQ